MNSTYKLCGFLTLIVATGCDRVEVDRTPQWDNSSRSVAFQHNDQGLFVGKVDGSGVQNIFAPDDSTLAVSTPLVHPRDGRLLFVTAHPLEGATISLNGKSSFLGTGSAVGSLRIRYRAWVKDPQKTVSERDHKPLFEAKCDHLGYVAAGLAVRWSPTGDEIYFVDKIEKGELSLFAFNLQSGDTRRVFPESGSHLIFNFSPQGGYLACGLASFSERMKSGLWIGTKSDESLWWHVDGSEHFSQSRQGSTIELLRASRPSWSFNDEQFAFISHQMKSANEAKGEESTAHGYFAHLVNAATHHQEVIRQTDNALDDLAWSRDGVLGFRESSQQRTNKILMWKKNEGVREIAGNSQVHRFIGFDPKGESFAYLALDPSRFRNLPGYYLGLLLPMAGQQHRLLVCQTETPEHEKEILSGVSVAYPNWSPDGTKLSLWLTFQPSYRAMPFGIVTMFSDGGFTSLGGDPAAVVDLKTNEIEWMVTSPLEETFVGHYYLARHEFKKAGEWYDKANRHLKIERPTSAEEFMTCWIQLRNPYLYQAYCFEKLGRADDALRCAADFSRTFYPIEPAKSIDGKNRDPIMPLEIFPSDRALERSLLRELSAAEMYASVDAVDDGIAMIDQRFEEATSPIDRLACSIVLSELLLIANKRSEHISTVTDRVIPAISVYLVDRQDKVQSELDLFSLVMGSLFPACSQQFLSTLSDEDVRLIESKWRQIEGVAKEKNIKLFSGLALHAALVRLKDVEAASLVAGRVRANPDFSKQGLSEDLDVDKILSQRGSGINLAPHH